MPSCKTSFVLHHSKQNEILENRIYVQPSLLITQRKKGTKWNCDDIQVSLGKKYNGKTCFCFIGEEQEEKENSSVSISKSELIFFGNDGFLKEPVDNGQVTFGLDRIFKERSKQVTKPHFLLCFVVDNAVVALSEKFHSRSRWGVETNDSQEIFARLQTMGRNPQNLDLILKIDSVKALWRGNKSFQHKLEKTCWLQARLIEDTRQGLNLVERSTEYHKTKSYDKTLQIIEEVDALISASKITQAPTPKNAATTRGGSKKSSSSRIKKKKISR